MQIAFFKVASLQRLNVFSLPALGPLGDVELHGLALLQALETARLDRREVHKNIFAILTADEAVAFGVIEPLYCSLFCHVDTGVPFNRFTLERFGSSEGRLLAVKAGAAHDRFGLTYIGMVRAECAISKLVAGISAPERPPHALLGGDGVEIPVELLLGIAAEFQEHDAVAELRVTGDDAPPDDGSASIEPKSRLYSGADR